MLKIRFEMTAQKWILWRYGHGRLADTWILTHVATGIAGGWLGLITGWRSVVFLSLAILVYFVYELWEAYIGIVEDVENALADVAAGALGTALVLWLDKVFNFDFASAVVLFVISTVAALALLFIGYRVYLGRVVRKEVVRIYPDWQTPSGQTKIIKDQILFFGLSLSGTFVPIIVIGFGTAAGWLWAILSTGFIFLVRAQVK